MSVLVTYHQFAQRAMETAVLGVSINENSFIIAFYVQTYRIKLGACDSFKRLLTTFACLVGLQFLTLLSFTVRAVEENVIRRQGCSQVENTSRTVYGETSGCYASFDCFDFEAGNSSRPYTIVLKKNK